MTPERQPIFRLLLLALMLGAGLQIVLAVVLGWSASVCEQFIGKSDRYESFSMLKDGTPVIVSRSVSDYYDREGRTLDGKPVAREKLERTMYGGFLSSLKPSRRQIGRVNWTGRIAVFSDYRQPAKYWHFIHTGRKEGQGYFEGFDNKTKLRVGYIGRNGPTSTKPSPEECFDMDGRRLPSSGRLASNGRQLTPSYYFNRSSFFSYYPEDDSQITAPPWTAYLKCGNELLEIDLREQTVRKLMELDEPYTIEISRRNMPEMPPGPNLKEELAKRPWCRDHLAIRTLDKITLFNPRADTQGVAAQEVFEIPAKARGSQLSFYQFPDGEGMLQVSRRRKGGIAPVDLYWLDDTGKFDRDTHLELVARGGPPTDTRLVAAGIGVMAPVPVVWTVASFVAMPLAYAYSGEVPGYSAGLARSLWESWPGLLISLAIAGVAGWWCVKLQHRYAAQWTRTWVVFIGVFGLPAFLGYLLHRCWPVRVECPACSHLAPRDRLACSACDADFPEPVAEGIEVFA